MFFTLLKNCCYCVNVCPSFLSNCACFSLKKLFAYLQTRCCYVHHCNNKKQLCLCCGRSCDIKIKPRPDRNNRYNDKRNNVRVASVTAIMRRIRVRGAFTALAMRRNRVRVAATTVTMRFNRVRAAATSTKKVTPPCPCRSNYCNNKAQLRLHRDHIFNDTNFKV